MQGKKYALIFTAVLLLFTAVNFIVSLNGYTAERFYEYGRNVYSADMIRKTDRYLEGLSPEEYSQEYERLGEEYSGLERFLRAETRISDRPEKNLYRAEFSEEEARKVVESFGIGRTEAENRMSFINLCRTQLKYAAGYSDYILSVQKNTDDMLNSGLFSEDKMKKIIHTGSRYYLLGNVKVSAVSDEGVKLLFSDRLSDVFAVLAALFCAFVYSLRLKSGNDETLLMKTGFFRYSAAFAVFAAGIYVLNAVTADRCAGLGDLSRTVQSLRDFKLCPLTVSAGEFLALRIFLKIAACMTVYFSAVLCLTSEKKLLVCTAAAAVTAEEILRFHTGSSINFISLWKPESVFSGYSSIRVSGEYINSYPVFIGLGAVFPAALLLLSYRFVNRLAHSSAEKAEKAYLDEVNSRYNESRLIRHDIKNHLSAIAGLLDAGDTEGARRYIGEISAEIENIKPPVKTGSGVLDALLFKKYLAASGEKIRIYTEFASDFSGYGFSDYDLCGIFSNILDNAFEACRMIEEDGRFVTLSVREQMNMICITCENPFTEIKKDADGFATMKPDRRYHGLGLKRISGIAEKYGGSTDIITEDGIFTVSVLLMKKTKPLK